MDRNGESHRIGLPKRHTRAARPVLRSLALGVTRNRAQRRSSELRAGSQEYENDIASEANENGYGDRPWEDGGARSFFHSLTCVGEGNLKSTIGLLLQFALRFFVPRYETRDSGVTLGARTVARWARIFVDNKRYRTRDVDCFDGPNRPAEGGILASATPSQLLCLKHSRLRVIPNREQRVDASRARRSSPASWRPGP
jgi:hypothetical protein